MYLQLSITKETSAPSRQDNASELLHEIYHLGLGVVLFNFLSGILLVHIYVGSRKVLGITEPFPNPLGPETHRHGL